MPCYLVYATAPTGMRARDANDALNAYVADGSHGIAVVHDHFTGRPHGGFAIVFPRNKHEPERPTIQARSKAGRFTAIGLVFALTPVGFDAQMAFTLDRYGHTSLDALRAAEPTDPRYWWQRDPEASEGTAS